MKLKVRTEFPNVWGEYRYHGNPYIQGTTVPCDRAVLSPYLNWPCRPSWSTSATYGREINFCWVLCSKDPRWSIHLYWLATFRLPEVESYCVRLLWYSKKDVNKCDDDFRMLTKVSQLLYNTDPFILCMHCSHHGKLGSHKFDDFICVYCIYAVNMWMVNENVTG